MANLARAIAVLSVCTVATTTQETLYTDTKCDALTNDHAFLMLPVRLTVHWNEGSAGVEVATKEAGSLTFTAAHAWLASR